MRFALRISIVAALVIGASLAIFFGFVARSSTAAPCTGGCRYEFPVDVLVAKVSIPKGTSASAIGSKRLTSTKSLRPGERPPGVLFEPYDVRGEVTIRAIPAGALLNASDFALHGPIYYPRGYPKSIPASQIPGKMSLSIGPAGAGRDFAVAPGVWVDGSTSEAALDLHVAHGTLVGYCRSIRSFQAHNPDFQLASKCWPK